MQNSFTNWSGNELYHHGIPGMKWGVRKYQNEDGSLTSAGKARYGEGGSGASARKMQRDLNRLDQGYANAAARREKHFRKSEKLVEKSRKYSNRKGFTNQNSTREDIENAIKGNKKLSKMMTKANSESIKGMKAHNQAKSIENLQWRILHSAHTKGYTVNSKAVKRTGMTGKAKVGSLLGVAGTLMLGPGNIQKVSGSKFKVRKKGDGGTHLMTYGGRF